MPATENLGSTPMRANLQTTIQTNNFQSLAMNSAAQFLNLQSKLSRPDCRFLPLGPNVPAISGHHQSMLCNKVVKLINWPCSNKHETFNLHKLTNTDDSLILNRSWMKTHKLKYNDGTTRSTRVRNSMHYLWTNTKWWLSSAFLMSATTNSPKASRKTTRQVSQTQHPTPSPPLFSWAILLGAFFLATDKHFFHLKLC